MIKLEIVKKYHLDKNKLKEIKSFVERNNTETGFPEFFYWDAIEHRIERPVSLDWLCYTDGKLVAYVAIYYFNSSVLDVNVSLTLKMYQYSHDIFSKLYDELYKSFGKHRLFASVFKINFENSILKNTLADLGATVVGMSKYMQRDIDGPIFDSVMFTIKEVINNHNRKEYLFYLDDESIGKVNVIDSDDQILIEDLWITPAMQDNNYELAMLQEICNIAHNNKSLLVEIDSDFSALTTLYNELGFYDVAIIHNYDRELNFVNAEK